MYETRNILVFLGICGLASFMLLTSCNGNKAQTPIASNERKFSDFEFLKLGMSYAEVVENIGESDRDIGSGVHLFVYELSDGTEVLLSFVSLDALQAVYRYDPQKDTRVLILGPEE
jgi:hypothetical protein